jgi:hypothetical protein
MTKQAAQQTHRHLLPGGSPFFTLGPDAVLAEPGAPRGPIQADEDLGPAAVTFTPSPVRPETKIGRLREGYDHRLARHRVRPLRLRISPRNKTRTKRLVRDYGDSGAKKELFLRGLAGG